jgi:hypothetical protein
LAINIKVQPGFYLSVHKKPLLMTIAIQLS